MRHALRLHSARFGRSELLRLSMVLGNWDSWISKRSQGHIGVLLLPLGSSLDTFTRFFLYY